MKKETVFLFLSCFFPNRVYNAGACRGNLNFFVKGFKMDNDFSPLYSALASDPDLQEIVRLFVNEMPDRTATFEKHLASGDKLELSRAVHQLKGAAGSHGFMELSRAAAALESTIKANTDGEAMALATTNLIALCHRATALPAPASG